MQELFASPYMRINNTSDVIGVEICGALKNVLAIAAGIVEGLHLGNNAMAALVTQVQSSRGVYSSAPQIKCRKKIVCLFDWRSIRARHGTLPPQEGSPSLQAYCLCVKNLNQACSTDVIPFKCLLFCPVYTYHVTSLKVSQDDLCNWDWEATSVCLSFSYKHIGCLITAVHQA